MGQRPTFLLRLVRALIFDGVMSTAGTEVEWLTWRSNKNVNLGGVLVEAKINYITLYLSTLMKQKLLDMKPEFIDKMILFRYR